MIRSPVFELDCADLVVIAGQVLGIGPAAALDRLDVPAAQAALAEARPADVELSGTVELSETGAADAGPAAAGLAAAGLMRALLRHRPFAGESQQVAVAAGLQFLALNGWQADLEPPGAALVVVEGLASGRLSSADAAAWLSARLSSYSVPPVREAPMRARLPGRRLFRAVDPRPRAGVRTPVTGFIPFTDDAREVAVLAREEATRLGLDHPGPEQFLLALTGTGPGVAARALERLGISPEAVRQQLAQIAAGQPQVRSGPDTPLAMWVMPRAVGEAVAHGQDYIGTEHILLALFHAGDDTAARTLASLGAGEREVRAAITAVADQPGPIRPAPGRGRKPGARDDEIGRLRHEVARLNELLREHGIEPGEGNRRSA
jgi:Clp amino terminal domain, pathogenicity island component